MSGMVVSAGPVPTAGLGPAARACAHRGRAPPRGRAVRGLRAALQAAVWTISAMLVPASAQRLTLHYQERPPYSAAGIDGHVHGLLATPAARALAAARIEFVWAQTPGQRQLALIQSGRGLHCGLGWFHNDERAARGKFSRPLYRDLGFVALARRAAAMPAAPLPPEQLLADRRLRLLVKEGYSYGRELDALIARHAREPLATRAEPLQILQMLRSGRADWTIASAEDAALHVDDTLVALAFSGQPPGPTRHLYCSADFPDDWLARIDAALAAVETGDGNGAERR